MCDVYGAMNYSVVFLFIAIIISVPAFDATGNREIKKHARKYIQMPQKGVSPSVTTETAIPFSNMRRTDTSVGVLPSVGYQRRRSSHTRLIDQDWLIRNITALWKFMRQIKRDVKQIKKQTNWKKGSNHNNKNGATKSKRKEQVAEVKCDQSWYRPHPNLCKSSKNATVCDGNGDCVCGQCQCKSPHYGEFCQCNDMSCQSFEGELCGGVRHGQCRCKECVCRPNFTGPACECSMKTEECSKDGVLCSERGTCHCNSCQCADGFTGSLCEEDIYSASVCERIKPCVLCQAYGIDHHKCDNCNLKIKTVTEVTDEDKKTCVYFYRGCFLKYSYAALKTEGEQITVYTSEKLNCD